MSKSKIGYYHPDHAEPVAFKALKENEDGTVDIGRKEVVEIKKCPVSRAAAKGHFVYVSEKAEEVKMEAAAAKAADTLDSLKKLELDALLERVDEFNESASDLNKIKVPNAASKDVVIALLLRAIA